MNTDRDWPLPGEGDRITPKPAPHKRPPQRAGGESPATPAREPTLQECYNALFRAVAAAGFVVRCHLDGWKLLSVSEAASEGAGGATSGAPETAPAEVGWDFRLWQAELLRLIDAHWSASVSAAQRTRAAIVAHAESAGMHWRARAFLAERAGASVAAEPLTADEIVRVARGFDVCADDDELVRLGRAVIAASRGEQQPGGASYKGADQ